MMAMIAVTLGGFGILDDFWEGVGKALRAGLP
jgi:hypothetical protein